MFKRFAAIVTLMGIVSVAAVACGGGDDEDAAAPPAAAAAAAPTVKAAAATGIDAQREALGLEAGKTRGETRVEVDLSQEGGTVDFTIVVVDGSGYQMDTAFRDRFEPNLLTFKAGQTANLTLAPENTKSALKHSFTAPVLGINESIKYGQPTSFTYTFDTPGTYQYFCTVKNQMVGTITVVQ